MINTKSLFGSFCWQKWVQKNHSKLTCFWTWSLIQFLKNLYENIAAVTINIYSVVFVHDCKSSCGKFIFSTSMISGGNFWNWFHIVTQDVATTLKPYACITQSATGLQVFDYRLWTIRETKSSWARESRGLCILFMSFLSFSHRDVAPELPRSLPLTLVEESGATQLWSRPLHLHPQFPNSPIKRRPRKSRRILQKRFIFTYWLSDFQHALWSFVLSAYYLLPHREGLAGWAGSLGRERMRLTYQMIKTNL